MLAYLTKMEELLDEDECHEYKILKTPNTPDDHWFLAEINNHSRMGYSIFYIGSSIPGTPYPQTFVWMRKIIKKV